MSDLFLFAVFPWLALAVLAGGLVYRVTHLRDSLSARSSQFLEARAQRLGSVPWHWAIVLILLAHLGAIFLPGPMARLLGNPVRLYVLEVTGLALGFLALAGLALLVLRRFALLSSTTVTDWLLLAALLLEVSTGVAIALSLRWGSLWFLGTASPWLASLAALNPQIDRVAVLPALVKLHFLNGFVVLALLPLSRLVHAVLLPLHYLWRPPQVVSWR